MLVLTRFRNESIIIDDIIKITIVSCNNGKVKVGIDAPKEIPVHREEIYNAIKTAERMKGINHDETSSD